MDHTNLSQSYWSNHYKLGFQNIVLDLDGTIIDENNQLKSKVCKGLKKLNLKGFNIFIATGRSPVVLENVDFIKTIIPYINKNIVCGNGSFIYNYETGDIKSLAEIDNSNFNRFYQLHSSNCFFLIEDINGIFADSTVISNYFSDIYAIDTSLIEIKDLNNYHPNKLQKIFIIPKVMNNFILDVATKWVYDNADIFYHKEKNFLIIFPKNNNKIRGIHYLFERENIDIKKTIAIGNDRHDVEIFKNCGIGIAVENCDDILHKVATIKLTISIGELLNFD